MKVMIIAAALLASGCSTQNNQATADAAQFSGERMKADIAFLADDKLEGRNAGERGYDLAAAYVAARFASIGLQPAINGSWYQQVPMVETKLGPSGARVIIGGTSFANGGEVLMGPSATDPRQSITAPVVFAGYGMYDPARGIDDFEGLDVRGKIVATLSGFPKGMASDIGAHLASEKGKAAEKHGAIGTIGIMTPTAEKVFAWKRRAEYHDVPGMTWVANNGTPYSSAPGIRTGASLNTPAAEALFKGAPTTLKAVLDEAERDGGRPKGFALAQQVTLERESTTRRLTSPNVVAVLPGSDPKLKNEYVVVMGHLDHDGVDESLAGDKIYNGAMDNAAGIATMLEAARALVNSPNRPKRSILFAAVTAEEDGLLGAQYLAKHPIAAGGKVVGVVNLDMPLLTYDFQDVIAFGAEHSTLGPVVEQAAAKANVKLSPDPEPEQSTFVRSDHYRFVQEGVPSVFLVTGMAGPGKAANDDFNAKHYHQVSDDMSRPFDWKAAAKFAWINYLITRAIADAPEAPQWYQGSFFGEIFAKSAPKAARPTS